MIVSKKLTLKENTYKIKNLMRLNKKSDISMNGMKLILKMLIFLFTLIMVLKKMNSYLIIIVDLEMKIF